MIKELKVHSAEYKTIGQENFRISRGKNLEENGKRYDVKVLGTPSHVTQARHTSHYTDLFYVEGKRG